LARSRDGRKAKGLSWGDRPFALSFESAEPIGLFGFVTTQQNNWRSTNFFSIAAAVSTPATKVSLSRLAWSHESAHHHRIKTFQNHFNLIQPDLYAIHS